MSEQIMKDKLPLAKYAVALEEKLKDAEAIADRSIMRSQKRAEINKKLEAKIKQHQALVEAARELSEFHNKFNKKVSKLTQKSECDCKLCLALKPFQNAG